jgi:hypothetical protein
MTIHDDYVLQYTKPGQEGEGDLVIGLDFGTSASKVVIQVPYLPGNPAYAVDFGEVAHSSMPYLLPTRLWITRDGECSLYKRDGAFEVIDIKLELFSKDSELFSNHGPTKQKVLPEEAAVSYLALLLRFARCWFLQGKRDVIGHLSKLNWWVNLGVPSPHVEDNDLKTRFERIGKAAWILSVLDQKVTLDKAKKELRLIMEAPQYWEHDGDGILCEFSLIPEIAAGAVGYAHSDMHKEGLHVMVDVGASTIDVCSFNLYNRRGTDNYALLTADVQQLGTIRLHQTRIQAITTQYEMQAQILRDEHDPLKPITDDIEDYLPSNDSILDAIRRGEKELKHKCQRMIMKVVHEARKRRDPNAKAWSEGAKLPMLLIGGGSQLGYFDALIRELDEWLTHYIKNEGIEFVPIPLPKTIPNNATEHRRLTVAWGLSHLGLDIGTITPADRIPDIDPPDILDWQCGFISKDQV